jgi:hypothetical protein
MQTHADAILDESLTLDLATLASLLGTSKTSLQRASAAGRLPLPLFSLGGRKVFARTSDVRALLAALGQAPKAESEARR